MPVELFDELGRLSVKRRSVDMPLLPFGPVTDRLIFPNQGGSDGASLDKTFRSSHLLCENTEYIRIVWVNFETGTTNKPTTSFTLNAAIDYLPAGGAINSVAPVALTFGGKNTITVDRGGIAISDPLIGPFAKGDRLLVRSHVVLPTGGRWPCGPVLNRGYEGAVDGDATLTANHLISFPFTVVPAFTCCMIAGPTSDLTPTVAGIGDSIMDGAGDSTGYQNDGFFMRAVGSSMGYLRISAPGERASNVAGFRGFAVRGLIAMNCRNVVCEYGTNDLGNSTLAQLKANLLAIWNLYSRPGVRVFQTTIIPKTTSTDSWATIANQTPTANEQDRKDLNVWLRAGAPLLNGVPVDAGTAGAVIAGVQGHPLYQVFDTAATCEVNSLNVLTLNGGYWPVNGSANYPTSDGIHPSGAMHTAMAGAIVTSSFA